MHSAQECREKADALVTLAEMFPDKADAYRDAERRWRELEARTLDQDRSARGAPVRSGP